MLYIHCDMWELVLGINDGDTKYVFAYIHQTNMN